MCSLISYSAVYFEYILNDQLNYVLIVLRMINASYDAICISK